MKQKIFTVAIALIVSLTTLMAQQIQIGNSSTFYELTGTAPNLTLTISGRGDMPDFINYSEQPWYAEQNDITSLVIGSSITGIGRSSFVYLTGITSVVIPEGIENIGYSAFGFTGLTSVTLPSSLLSVSPTSFYGNTSLEEINISDNETYKSIDGILYIHNPELGFNNMTELVTYPAGKAGDYIIPQTVTHIHDFAIYSALKMTSVVIPEGVIYIGSSNFYDCDLLPSVTLPASVSVVGFPLGYDHDVATTTIVCLNPIPPQVIDNRGDDIDHLALMTLKVPRRAIDAYQNAAVWNEFGTIEAADCPTSGTVFSVGNNRDEIIEWSIEGSTLTFGGSGSMPGYMYEGTPWSCESEAITDIIIGEDILCVGDNAFSNLFSLKSMTLHTTNPDGLWLCSPEAIIFGNVNIFNAILYVPFEMIDLYSNAQPWANFGEIRPISCQTSGSLTYTTNNPDNIVYWEINNGTLTFSGDGNIPSYYYGQAPWACDGSAITNLIIGDGIMSIREEAFSNFVNLKTVTVYWQNPAPIQGSSFGNIGVANITLYVPAGTVDTYRMAPDWRGFKIVENMEQEVEITGVTDNSIEISWSEVTGTTMYRISVFDNMELLNPVYYEEVPANSSKAVLSLKASKTYTVLVEGLMSAKTYFYNIEAIDNSNNAIAGLSGNFTTTGNSSAGKPAAGAIAVYATLQGIAVANATAGETIAVYSLSGMQIATARAEGSETNVAVQARGVYIVRVGGFATKVVF